jgi:hypothetical protein
VGHTTLVVSTDPAHSLSDSLAQVMGFARRVCGDRAGNFYRGNTKQWLTAQTPAVILQRQQCQDQQPQRKRCKWQQRQQSHHLPFFPRLFRCNQDVSSGKPVLLEGVPKTNYQFVN